MFKQTKIAAIVLMSIFLNACSTGYNIPNDDKINNAKNKENEIINEWRKVQSPIQFIQTDNNFLITRKNIIPEFIKNIQVDNLNLYKESTFEDLIGVFSSLGVQLSIKEEKSTPNEEVEDISKTILKIHNYSGTVGDLIELLENTYNISFNYQTGNIITIEKRTLYIASVPQNDDIVKQISEHLDTMGATKINYSYSGGFLLYKASRMEQEIIKEYLDSFYKNFASVKLQLAVISLSLNKKENKGFDWSQFTMQLGNLAVLEDLAEKNQNTVNTGTGNGTTTTTPTPTTPTQEVSYGSNLKDLKSGVALSGDNAGLVMKNDNFSLKAVYNLLNSYGTTDTTQSVYVESTSGTTIEVKSVQEIPYTSGINSNVTTGGGAGIVSNGAQTEKIEVGLDIEALPFYDFTKDVVTLNIKMKLKSLIGFVELNAGNGNGTLKQPQTQNQEFNSVLKIRPGEAAIVGGITYDVISDSRANLNFMLDRDNASRNLEITRSSMFLLLRPTVSVFADFESEIKQQQDIKAKKLIEKENQRKIIEERKRKEIELKNKELEEKKKAEEEEVNSLNKELKHEASKLNDAKLDNPVNPSIKQIDNSVKQVQSSNKTVNNGTIPAVTKENNNGSN